MSHISARAWNFRNLPGSRQYICASCRSALVSQATGRKLCTSEGSTSIRYPYTARLLSNKAGKRTARRSPGTHGNILGEDGEGETGLTKKRGVPVVRSRQGKPQSSSRQDLSRQNREKKASSFLRNLIAKDSLQREYLDAAQRKQNKYKQTHDADRSELNTAMLKLEHNIAASVALSNIDTSGNQRKDLSSGRLLRELAKKEAISKEKLDEVEKDVLLSDLPISPRTHPRLSAIRNVMMVRKPKEPALEEMTEFEQRLRENPYAHILSSQVRMCIVTGMRMPKALLSNFMLKVDPDSGLPWMVPSGYEPRREEKAFAENGFDGEVSPLSLWPNPIQSTEQRARERNDHGDSKSPTAADFKFAGLDESEYFGSSESDEVAWSDSSPALRKERNSFPSRECSKQAKCDHSGPSTAGHIDVTLSKGHVVSTWSAMQYLCREKHTTRRNLPIRWRTKLKRAINDVVIRDGMDLHIRDLTSHNIVRQLAWLRKTFGDKVISVLEEGEVQMQYNEHSVLLSRKESANSSAADSPLMAVLNFEVSPANENGKRILIEDLEAEAHNTAQQRDIGARLPLYNMQELVGKKELEWLKNLGANGNSHKTEENPYCGPLVVIRSHEAATKVLGLLWKLQQFRWPGELDRRMGSLDC